jgi:hypothetical protein
VRAFRRILATEEVPTYVTKVLLTELIQGAKSGQVRMRCLRILVSVGLLVCPALVLGAAVSPSNGSPSRPAEALYLQLGSVGLDPTRVYQVRGASLERSAIHITLEDGSLAFTQDVMGHITGAFFEGDGEVLLMPPNEVERMSMSMFTGMAILEERFATAYFRFNDETAAELRPDLRPADTATDFIARWGQTARNLSQADAMRLLMSFNRILPVAASAEAGDQDLDSSFSDPGDHMLHARLQGTKLGVFDVYYDSMAGEQVQAGQARAAENGTSYYDVWTSFSPGQSRNSYGGTRKEGEKSREDSITVRRYAIATEVKPPKQIHAEARLQLDVRQDGTRMLLFELSRFLQVESVEMAGTAVEFIHNPAIEGTQLSRRANDLVAVVLPRPARAGQHIELRFVYGGEVLAEAGSGLLYVGARGTWYPNRGLAMADFDLEFHYPLGWTLVATGKPMALPAAATTLNGYQLGHWVSERPIPVAGFNLGKYKLASARAGDVTVEIYAASGVERDFPSPPVQSIEPDPADPAEQRRRFEGHALPHNPSPAKNASPIAEVTALAIQYYADRLGPFPYSRLALTQMPGPESQGWPGLVFLSSYAFLNDDERTELHVNSFRKLLQQQIPAHETAHQWWGDLITWSTYRDQWLSEGLANYCSLMLLQEKNPAGFRTVMEGYRRELVEKNKDGLAPKDAGPVTLGARLLSSHSPEGYEAISYGRGTWLFHMLRTMLRDATMQEQGHKAGSGSDEPFVRSLRKLRQRYEGKAMSTREMLDVFAENLPEALRYEGKNSLDWFLESWVNGTAMPTLELKAVKFAPKGAGTWVSGTIVQKDAPGNLVTSVPVYGLIAGRPPVLLGRVFADGEESSFHLSAPAGTRKIELDPNATILTSPK